MYSENYYKSPMKINKSNVKMNEGYEQQIHRSEVANYIQTLNLSKNTIPVKRNKAKHGETRYVCIAKPNLELRHNKLKTGKADNISNVSFVSIPYVFASLLHHGKIQVNKRHGFLLK